MFKICHWREKDSWIKVFTLLSFSVFMAPNRKQHFMVNKPQHGLKQFPLIIHCSSKVGFQRLEDAFNLNPDSFVSKSVCCWEGVCHSVLLVIQLKQDL